MSDPQPVALPVDIKAQIAESAKDFAWEVKPSVLVAWCESHVLSAYAAGEAAGSAGERERGERLRENVAYVLKKFRADEAAGYRSRDRQFAIEILGMDDAAPTQEAR